MRRVMLAVVLLVSACFASACNLNNQPVTPSVMPTTEPIQQAETPTMTLTALPGLAVTPLATRTPFGNNPPPTSQLIATTSGFPTLASGESAEISSPVNNATLSGAPLYVSGVAHHLPDDQFTLQIFDGNGQALTSGQTITLSNPNHAADVPWSASVTLANYTGAAQIRIIDSANAVIGSVNVTIIPGSGGSIVRPAVGAYVGSITSPINGSSVSGDPITVTGTAGGIPDNQFTLLLLDGSGTVLNSQLITLTGAEQNNVPWSATLGTSGYHGSAEIRAVAINNGQQITLASVKVILQ